MKNLVFVLLFVVLFGCANPAQPDTIVVAGAPGESGPAGEPGQPVAVQTPPNPIGEAVAVAKYIRLPGSIVSRGMFGAFSDPDEAICNEVETVYIFYDDNSIVQYKPAEGMYSYIAVAAKLTCEIRNRDYPDAPWDYIANNPPPPPPPVTKNDPVLGPLEIAFCDDLGVIHWQMTADNNAEYDRIVLGPALGQTLELWNRDNDPDCHAVLGGKL